MKMLSRHTLSNLCFHIALALLCTHEIDAVARQEWQLLPVLSSLPNEAGFFWFVVLHIPLFAWVFWATSHASATIAQRSRMAVSAFMVVHGVLHFALSGHPLYTFTPPIETITVYGGAIMGLAYLGLVSIARDDETQGS